MAAPADPAGAAAYRHAQPGWSMLLLVGGTALVIIALMLPGAPQVGLPVAVGLLVLGLLFHRLVVEVDERCVRLAFGVGLVRRSIPLAEIVDARPVTNRWWYGWGLRLTPHGWLWNVSGLDAVEITYRSGRRFRIGTDEPEALTRAVRRAVGLAGEPPE